MTDEDRHSHALDAELITDPGLKAQKEVSNGLKQSDAVAEQIEYWLDPERPCEHTRALEPPFSSPRCRQTLRVNFTSPFASSSPEKSAMAPSTRE